MGKIYSVQALRFLAALLVIVDHTTHYVNMKLGGFNLADRFFDHVGGFSVMIFFAISGFVIPASCQKLTALQFFAARMLRIYLGFFFALAVTLAIKTYLFGSVPFVSIQNLTLLPFGEIPYPLFIEWSLIFEVFFYTLFALAWVFRSNAVIIGSLATWLCLILFGGYYAIDKGSPTMTTFSTILFNYHNIAFIFGALTYYIRSRVRSLDPVICLMIGAGLCFVGPVLTINAHIGLICDGLAAASFLIFAILIDNKSASMRRFARLGNYSYGMYLMHATIITVSLSVADTQTAPSIAVAVAVLLLALAGSCLFGAAEHRLHIAVRSRLKSVFGRYGAGNQASRGSALSSG